MERGRILNVLTKWMKRDIVAYKNEPTKEWTLPEVSVSPVQSTTVLGVNGCFLLCSFGNTRMEWGGGSGGAQRPTFPTRRLETMEPAGGAVALLLPFVCCLLEQWHFMGEQRALHYIHAWQAPPPPPPSTWLLHSNMLLIGRWSQQSRLANWQKTNKQKNNQDFNVRTAAWSFLKYLLLFVLFQGPVKIQQ